LPLTLVASKNTSANISKTVTVDFFFVLVH
jgi:hypothetical protein